MSKNDSPAATPPRWLLIVCFCLAILPATIAAWTERDLPHLGIFHDDAVYWSNAKALAQGDGYHIMSLPGTPFQTKYPPLYPALLSLIWRLNPDFPSNLPLAMLMTWLFVPPFFWLCRRVLLSAGATPWVALVTTTFIMVAPMFTVLSTSLMSEVPFCLLLFASLRLLDGELTPRRAALAGVVAGLAYLVRTGAIPLIATVPFVLFLKGKRVAAVAFVAGMAPFIAGWMFWVSGHRAPGTDIVTLYYTDYLRYQLDQIPADVYPVLIWKNIANYCVGVGQWVIFLFEETIVNITITRFLGLAAIIGTIRLAWRTRQFQYALYALGLSSILFVWHYPPNWRFVFPVLPMLLAGFFTEVSGFIGMIRLTWTRNKRSDRSAAIIIGVPAVLAAIAAFYVNTDSLVRFVPDLFGQERYIRKQRIPVYAWVHDHVPATALFTAYDDVVLYLYSGRRSVGPPLPPVMLYREDATAVDRLIKAFPGFLDAQRVSHVLMTPLDFRRDLSSSREKFQRELEQDPAFRTLHQEPTFTVFERVPAPR